jgi:ATP-binding cassette subfamily B protein
VVAIVGPNGAGKSTLIKLACRFYDPDGGRITLDGVELRDLPLETLRRQITVLFQEPVRYNATAAENIALGDLAAGASRAEIEAAAVAAGADGPIARLPHGYETLLGKWFAGGMELSVGEWQRLALARAFLRRARLIILDEPTSAMDSWAEADWMERFRQLAAGRTAIIITHRFTTAIRADQIHVMEQGRIVESGSHQELLARGGRYAGSWAEQVQEYGSTDGHRLTQSG